MILGQSTIRFDLHGNGEHILDGGTYIGLGVPAESISKASHAWP